MQFSILIIIYFKQAKPRVYTYSFIYNSFVIEQLTDNAECKLQKVKIWHKDRPFLT